MALDVFDPGDAETRPYRLPWFPRELTGEPMVTTSIDDRTPRPGILNGRIYNALTPVTVGTRVHYRPGEWRPYLVDFSIPDVPAIDPDTMTEVAP